MSGRPSALPTTPRKLHSQPPGSGSKLAGRGLLHVPSRESTFFNWLAWCVPLAGHQGKESLRAQIAESHGDRVQAADADDLGIDIVGPSDPIEPEPDGLVERGRII